MRATELEQVHGTALHCRALHGNPWHRSLRVTAWHGIALHCTVIEKHCTTYSVMDFHCPVWSFNFIALHATAWHVQGMALYYMAYVMCMPLTTWHSWSTMAWHAMALHCIGVHGHVTCTYNMSSRFFMWHCCWRIPRSQNR